MPRSLAVALTLAIAAGCSGPLLVPHEHASDGSSDDGAAGAAAADAPAHDAGVGRDLGATSDAPQDTPAADSNGTGRDAPGADLHVSSFCDLATQTLTVASGPVSGVLTGPSRNPAVSCDTTTATGGPDAFFSLEVDAFTLVVIDVTSPVETLIAVRAGCGGDVSEVACGDLPPVSDTDAGGGPADAGVSDAIEEEPIAAGAGASGGHLSSVRVALAAGAYTVIVDTISLGSLTSAPFTISARALPQAANASCATPTLLASETSAQGNLDFGGQPVTACGATTGGALFYSVGVPAGQRLTVSASLMTGDHAWLPTLAAFGSCGGTSCLAEGRATAGSTQELDWINSGTDWRLVTFSVGADGPVNDAQFNVSVSLTDLLASCARPTPVADGAKLLNQNLLDAAPSMNTTCVDTEGPALYYVATLLPQQELGVTLVPGGGPSGQDPFIVAFRSACDSTCTDASPAINGRTTTNLTSSPETVLIEVSVPPTNNSNGPFELDVSMPLPPAGITVTPTAGLVTTEDGGTATFQVVLASPPTAAVTIGLSSDTPTEGIASPATLVFDANDWSQPQTVTVTGVDDQVSDGPRSYLIVTAPATSDDPRYAGMNAADVRATNLDNDAGLVFAGADELVTSEDGSAASFQVSLNRQPAATVTVSLSSSNLGEGTVSPAQLTFSTTSWNTPQTVTVTGVDDTITDGTQAYAVVTGPFVSSDPAYGGQNPPDVVVHNRDDDQAAVPLKLVSGTDECSPPSTLPLVADALNTLYLVLNCNNELELQVSTNGGVTFSSPTPIPGGEISNATYAVAAGDGSLYVAFQGSNGAIELTQTQDAGTTWSPLTPVALSGVSTMSAGAQTVIVAGSPLSDASPPPSSPGAISLVRSVDGGLTFLPPQALDFPVDSLAVEPDGKTVIIPSSLNSMTTIYKSTDAGVTFASIFVDTPAPGTLVAVGRQTILELEPSQTRLIDAADPTMIETGEASIASMGSLTAVAFDDRDGVTVLEDDSISHTVIFRVDATAHPSDPIAIGPRADLAGALALSRKAVASLLFSNTFVFFTVSTF